MADDKPAFLRRVRNDLKGPVFLEWSNQIELLAVELDNNGRGCQALSDAERDFEARSP